MFMGLLGNDLSKQLKDPGTYTKLVSAADDWAKRTVTLLSKIQGGKVFQGVEIISEEEASKYERQFKGFSGFCDKLATYTTEAKMKNFPYAVDEVKKKMETKALIEQVEDQLEAIKTFDTDISWLQQCKQYVLDTTLKTEIATAISKLGAILASNNAAQIDAYKNEIENYKNLYADWYLELYLKYRISETDNTKKHALLDSDEKYICDIFKEADFLPSGQYMQLLNQLSKLKPADPSVNKELILIAPYQEFNPLDYVEQEIASVKELGQQLNDILDQWADTLKEVLDDPIVRKKIDLLDKEDIQLLNDFKSGSLDIDKNNALKIRNAIIELHQGLEKVELSTESLKTTFNKPLTPDEAIDAFKEYIDEISKGKERDKIRIILR